MNFPILQRSPSLKGSSGGCWQQKQVSIKTLEGEFSVTMWASGAEDGEREDEKISRTFLRQIEAADVSLKKILILS